jgi:dCMP deaminase
MKTAFLAYIPVLHQGYLNFFDKHPEVKTLYLVDESLTHDFRQLVKDIRALSSETMAAMVETVDRFDEVMVVGKEAMKKLNDEQREFVVPDEEEMQEIVAQYLPKAKVTWDSIFLRWDRKKSESRSEVEPDVKISREKFDKEMIQRADNLAKKSSDWWRQVGAVILKDGKIIAESKNIHVPHDQQQYVDGDPRASYQSGEMFELSSSVHAESAAIAIAAREGIALEGTTMYAGTFPCPVCAKLIAEAGIKKLYYGEGYALLDGENVMKSKGVEIVKVEE